MVVAVRKMKHLNAHTHTDSAKVYTYFEDKEQIVLHVGVYVTNAHLLSLAFRVMIDNLG